MRSEPSADFLAAFLGAAVILGLALYSQEWMMVALLAPVLLFCIILVLP